VSVAVGFPLHVAVGVQYVSQTHTEQVPIRQRRLATQFAMYEISDALTLGSLMKYDI